LEFRDCWEDRATESNRIGAVIDDRQSPSVVVAVEADIRSAGISDGVLDQVLDDPAQAPGVA
jgi:hypothetical protein